jgi:crotonobetainyl-CoA:carnitine CoA-transferase CaiB-like acyl-CoA transferase
MGIAGTCLAGLIQNNNRSEVQPISHVDRRLASMWFAWSLRPQGWEVPPAMDPIAGDYEGRDGWIRLHTNAPHHREAALKVLGCAPDREAVARAVATRTIDDLEADVVEQGGCAAAMRSLDAWASHPQGAAVADEPLIRKAFQHPGNLPTEPYNAERPLSGFRVLDLTRVLAGPIAGRFLAAYGAHVLRIDPHEWEEPGVVPEVTLGKRCAGLDLTQRDDREAFERLLGGADVLLHGYRAGALDGLGYDEDARRRINPNLIDVSLNAYGWIGPWKKRRGFDSLVQMSSGIAYQGMLWSGRNKPTPLPVQALDHATGYLMAAAAITGLMSRLQDGSTMTAKLSLARTAHLLASHRGEGGTVEIAPETRDDLAPHIEQTGWGPAQRIRFPVSIAGSPARWNLPAGPLRSSPPEWP